ncbi:MAG: DUF917 domain-containing protein [Ignisphaera sp.]|nr:DUF917 domain-containing protein [Ignisphaera sp.]MCX8167673.1 DUF917 domain-containing protein [Ignisphaera sp.]MDW8085663.1 DUF917 domain-containing protein [Ignisphaera sp.]
MILSAHDIRDMALGAAILGAGGGGDPYIGMLMAIQAVEKGRKVELLDPDSADDSDFIVPVAMMGTPTVLIEKIPGGDEVIWVLRSIEKYYGREANYITQIEAGGVNSMIPIVAAAYTGKPLLNGDGMGRAFPELQMVTFHLIGVKATPMVLSDERGNSVVLDTIDNFWAERIARAITIKFGGSAYIAIYAMSGKDYKRGVVRYTPSVAMEIGRAIREAKRRGVNVFDAILDIVKGVILFRGKIIDVARFNLGGFARGEVTIEGFDDYRNSRMVVKFQNENLVAIRDGNVVATTPDIISILDIESAKPITTERLRYGLRVAVVGIPCDSKWRTEEGIRTVGPRYFGYDVDYVPIEVRIRGV